MFWPILFVVSQNPPGSVGASNKGRINTTPSFNPEPILSYPGWTHNLLFSRIHLFRVHTGTTHQLSPISTTCKAVGVHIISSNPTVSSLSLVPELCLIMA